jgi:hypothetical protein
LIASGAAGIDGAARTLKYAGTSMHQRDEEDEEDLRAYANVFARLTTGTPSPPPTRGKKIVTESRRRALEVGERLRERTSQLPHRIAEECAARLRGVRVQVANPARWRLPWRRADGRPPVPLQREPSIFLGLASFAFAFTVAWWTGGPTDQVPERKETFVAEQAVPTVSAPLPPPAAARPAALDFGQVLRTPGASEAAQLAVVDELSKDVSDDATKALLAGVDAGSLYVSMACLRALAGRSCDTVAAELAHRLDDGSWQRRAWAARILGANDCAGAGRRLAQRLAVEPDRRVQKQLQLAIDSLKEPGA